MPSNRELQKQNRDYLGLALWLFLGGILFILTYFAFEFFNDIKNSPEAGWLNLIGFSFYLLAGLFLIVCFDLLYLVLFLRWAFIGRKQEKSKDKAVYLS